MIFTYRGSEIENEIILKQVSKQFKKRNIVLGNIISGSIIITLLFLEFYLLFNNDNDSCALKNLQSEKEKDINKARILTIDMIIIFLLSFLIFMSFERKTFSRKTFSRKTVLFKIILLVMVLGIIGIFKLLFFYFRKENFMNNPTYSISLLILTGSIVFFLSDYHYRDILIIFFLILFIFHGYFSFFNRSYLNKIKNFLSIPFFPFDSFKLKENIDYNQLKNHSLKNYAFLLAETKKNIYEISFYLSIFNGVDYNIQNNNVEMKFQREYWNFKVFIVLDIFFLIISFFYKVKVVIITILFSGCAILLYYLYNCFSMKLKLGIFPYFYLLFSIFVFCKFLFVFIFSLKCLKISRDLVLFFSCLFAFVAYKIFFIFLKYANMPIYKKKKITSLDNTFNIYSIFTAFIIFMAIVISTFSDFFYGFIIFFMVVLLGNFIYLKYYS